MDKKNNTGKSNLESRVKLLENRLTKLETQLEKKLNRRKREYTDEQKKAIRARLLAGQEAARKRREAEAKTTKKVNFNNPEEVEVAEAQQPIEDVSL
ncbi:hypothetical protein ACFLYR_03505 [Chloroflexota bacterium]